MIIVDNALRQREERNNPIRVGLVGAGYMARGIVQQLLTPLTGMRLSAIVSRSAERAAALLTESHSPDVRQVDSGEQMTSAICYGAIAVATRMEDLCACEDIDVIVDTTGQVEYGCRLATTAIAHGKHLVLVNAELDATLGPLLKHRADQAGTVISNTDGDEPGVAMTLLRFVRTIGLKPVLAGNIKGFIDVHRNPDTQAGFAKSVGQDARMITSFADGTKLSLESTLLANATGLKVGRPGMYGHRCAHVREIIQHFSADDLLACPLVDYALGAEPGTGAYVVGYCNEPAKAEYLKYFKMGEGPLYVLYTPYHLPQLQIAVTIGSVALFRDPTVAPLGAPVCDVVAVAKRDLKQGETLDGIGGFTSYGQIVNSEDCQRERLLPMGLSDDCRLLRDVPADQPLTYADVELPAGRLCDELRQEQDELFAPASVGAQQSARTKPKATPAPIGAV